MKKKCLFVEDLKHLGRVMGGDLTELSAAFDAALVLITNALAAGRKVLAFGNGGSCADAEHLVAELVGRFAYDRPSLPAISLTVPTATLTALGNDYGYDRIFERQISSLGQSGDVAIGITTSGNSKNVLRALEAAKSQSLKTIALTGSRDSPCIGTADIVMKAPSWETPRIQEIHALLIHSLCRGVEENLHPRSRTPKLPAEKHIQEGQLRDFAASLKPWKSVFTNGCFDLLHPGHVTLLRTARNFGDLLILGLNTDDSVRRLKGTGRPYHTLENRILMLSAVECVDYVVPFSEDTPKELIEQLSPKVLVKGGDYKPENIVGADWVKSQGGDVHVVPLVPGHSTSQILGRHPHGL